MRIVVLAVLVLAVAMAAIGCGAKMTNPYVMKTDRVDQKLEEGNRGYVKGTPPPVGDRGDLKRPWIAVDVDLPDSSSASAPAAVEEKSVEQKPVEVKREVAVIKEETPTTIKTTTVVTEEEIK